jgi:hypothetical protein
MYDFCRNTECKIIWKLDVSDIQLFSSQYNKKLDIKEALSIIMMTIFGLPKQFHSLQNY